MEIKKIPKFRVICKDLKSKKHRTFTIYDSDSKIEFKEFVEEVEEKLKEI